MKKLSKITALLLTLMLTMSALAACGGGGGDTAVSNSEGANAEPNDGMQGIVYAIPEGWQLKDVEPGSFSNYGNLEEPFSLSITATTQDILKDYEGEVKDMTVAEYYKKYYTPDKKSLEKYNTEVNEIKICGVDAYSYERKENGKTISKGANWLKDDVIYQIGIMNNEIEFDDEGNITNDPEGASEKVLADLDYVLASVKEGDGNSIQNTEININGIGNMSFDAPEGYSVTESFDEMITMKKDDGEPYIQISKETEESLAQWEGEDLPKNLKEYYDRGYHEEVEKTKIAGYDGYLDITPSDSEVGDIYTATAYFMTEDSVYEIRMEASEEIWDDEGNIKEGVKPLSDDDIATFKAFVNSFKKK